MIPDVIIQLQGPDPGQLEALQRSYAAFRLIVSDYLEDIVETLIINEDTANDNLPPGDPDQATTPCPRMLIEIARYLSIINREPHLRESLFTPENVKVQAEWFMYGLQAVGILWVESLRFLH